MSELEKQLETLKKKRAEAIKECKFAQAKALDSHINSLKKQIEENKTHNKKLNARIKFNTAKEAVGKELVAAQTQMNEEEKNIRENYQQRLLLLEEKNQREAGILATKLSSDLQKANRPVTEAEELKNKAQKLASMGNFDLAEGLFNESNDIKERTINERVDAVMRKYRTDTSELEEKHQNEIAQCKEKRENAIKMLHDAFDLEVERKNKELNTVSIKLGLGQVESGLAAKSVTLKTSSVDIESTEINQANEGNTTLSKTTKSPTVTRKSPLLHTPRSRLQSRPTTPNRTSSLKK